MLTCAVGVTLEIMLRQKAVMLMIWVIEDSQLYDLSTTRDTSRSRQHTQVYEHLHHPRDDEDGHTPSSSTATRIAVLLTKSIFHFGFG